MLTSIVVGSGDEAQDVPVEATAICPDCCYENRLALDALLASVTP